MIPVWAQRQAELLRDCIVSPDVFQHMVDRLRDFTVPYQHALATEAGQRLHPVRVERRGLPVPARGLVHVAGAPGQLAALTVWPR